jgi:glc operon protein GlcG
MNGVSNAAVLWLRSSQAVVTRLVFFVVSPRISNYGYNPAPVLRRDADSSKPHNHEGYQEEKNVSLRSILKFMATLTILLCAAGVKAQQMPNPYGPPISLENAKKAAAAAIAEARKNNWTMALAIVDPNGTLVYYEKIDNTQIGSAQFAISKARSAALFKRPTKWFQDQVSKGGDGLRYLGLEGATPLEGGIPIVIEGKIVGAIALSGGTSSQDAQCAQVGADALK